MAFFYIAVFLSLIAGLLKITTLISFLAWFASYVVLLWPLKEKEELEKYFPAAMHVLIGFFIVIFGNIGWLAWAKYYNTVHDSHIFLTHILPAWEMTGENIQNTLSYIWNYPGAYTFREDGIYLFLVMLVFVLLNFKKFTKLFKLFLLFSILGSMAYVVLFLQQLRVHNYYFIDLMTLPVLVSAAFFLILSSYSSKWYYQLFIGLLAFVNVNLNINLSSNDMELAYRIEDGRMRGMSTVYFKTTELEAFQQSLGITTEERVLCIPGPAPNQTLIYHNRKGLTNFIFETYRLGELFFAKARGVNFMVLNTKDHPALETILSVDPVPIGVFEEELYFYKIDDVIALLRAKEKAELEKRNAK